MNTALEPRATERGSRGRWALALGVISSMALRFAFTRRAVGPQVVADESAYLAMSRWIADVGVVWNIGPASASSPGYSFLIAPLFKGIDDPELLFRCIIGANIVLGGLLVITYEALALRLTTLRRPWTVVVATIAATLPALVVTANHAWSDNLTPLVFAVVLLCGLRLLEEPGPFRVTLLALSVGAAFLTHTRLAALAVPAVLLMLYLWRRRRLRPIEALGGVVLTGLALFIALRLTRIVQDPIYPPDWNGQKSVKDDLLDRVTDVGPFILSFAGQLWYMLATTAGVAAFAIVAWGRAGVRWIRSRWRHRHDPRDERPDVELDDVGLRPHAAELIFTASLIIISFGVSVAFMTDRERSDHLVYGRYNEAFLGILVIVGLAALMSARTHLKQRAIDVGLAAVMLIGSGGLIRMTRVELLSERGATSTVLGLGALSEDPVQSVGRVTLMALIVLMLIAAASLLSRRSYAPVAVLVLVLIPFGTDRAAEPLALRGSRKAVSFTATRGLLHEGDTVWFAMNDGGETSQFYRFPFFNDDITVERQVEGDPWVNGPELMIGSSDSEMAPESGYRILWDDPEDDLALWVAPGDRQDAFESAGQLP